MNDKHIPLTDDGPKYKKKSTTKGQPRADHKHQYEIVLLTYGWQRLNVNTGKYETELCALPYRVCTICRRIDKTVWDEEYFIEPSKSRWTLYGNKNNLSAKALSLPKWEADDVFSKFAKPQND